MNLWALNICAGFAGLLTLTSAAQTSEDADAGAYIIKPIVIEGWEELDFGIIAPSDSVTANVVISPLGARTCAAELTCVGSRFSPAKFGITGEPDAAYTISVQSAATIRNTGNDALSVTGLVTTHTSGTLLNGYAEFMVGGLLTVPLNQSVGSYTGTYTVTVEYQ